MSLDMNHFLIVCFVNKLFFPCINEMATSLSYIRIVGFDMKLWRKNGSSFEGRFVVSTYWIEHFDLSMIILKYILCLILLHLFYFHLFLSSLCSGYNLVSEYWKLTIVSWAQNCALNWNFERKNSCQHH